MEKVGIKKQAIVVLISILIGISIGLAYFVFEFIVNEGSDWLWNSVLGSDIQRWRVIPIAIVLGLIYSLIIKIFKQDQIISSEPLSITDEIAQIKPTAVKDLVAIFVIGSFSLLAGASLGPEASLVALSIGIVAYVTGLIKNKNKGLTSVLALSAITALLSSFFLSLVPLVIPYLFLFKQKKLTIFTFLISTSAAVSAWFTVHLVKGEPFFVIPTAEEFNYKSILLAILFGFVAIVVTTILKLLISKLAPLGVKLDNKLPWYISAALFALVIGLLYWIGGETVQFSGNDGVQLLYETRASYTSIMFLGLMVVKILLTSWSTVTGYRGGQVFPTVYTAIAMSLGIGTFFALPFILESGVTIGAVTGVFIGMLNPLIGAVLAISLFPIGIIPVTIAAIIGGTVGSKVINQVKTRQ
jgi:H+/Cl- antiporter ClcA